MAQTYISGPAIARLWLRSRMTVNEHMRAGGFGPLLRHGRIRYAALAAVERRVGQRISGEQLAAAVGGYPERILILETGEE